jgi:hypothetical protein
MSPKKEKRKRRNKKKFKPLLPLNPKLRFLSTLQVRLRQRQLKLNLMNGIIYRQERNLLGSSNNKRKVKAISLPKKMMKNNSSHPQDNGKEVKCQRKNFKI